MSGARGSASAILTKPLQSPSRFTDALFACYDKPRQVTAKNDLG